ncbi:putative terpenoid synthase [Candidatus Competibacter denitrificans Run_A_D11]|uniref:Terpenoid synthase n=1 Tax=Candidatus Competibacter denitrificans Run_A_D11 TaxID=1400863 RepID=W6M3R4_9GAMM|nr:squalene/phytoene synthase family protein [Candidatus Competibacter denitrificans]CDI02396.1 putative terpenoid synthase [Candidatus Competibacter denitrificans Run_A_D11]HAS85633.1 squalene synthase HpnD [Candidatus Competibacteraceae bacterium]HRC69799.1 squalene/phytoene synthase family protein [Candidatus Competibacter denitrificans]
MSPEDYCYNFAAPPGSDFRYSLLGLPLKRRQALLALKAFCLETAQIVSECQDAGVARVKLDWWQAEVGRLFAGEPQHPVTRALRGPLADFNLPEEYFREILDGITMDLDYDAYPNFSGLMVYLHRRGSVPALLAAEILGYQDRRATPRFAHEAGIALILFDFLYDARRHAQCGRLYWPEEEMERYGIKASDLLAPQTTERLRQLFAFQAERIRHHYAQSLTHLPTMDRYTQYHLLIRLDLAKALLEEIAEDGYRLLEQRTSLPPLRKLWLAWRLRRREKLHRRRLPVVA